MNKDQYDSSQWWLNRIHEKITYRIPSFFSYLLTTRQAEVYYYNNLHQLGLQEAQRAATIAEKLKDNILKADAYNFCGLFCISRNRVRDGIIYFKKGIAICKEPPYPAGYADLTNPHHLYGNLSEAYDKIHQYDSALHFGRLSYDAAVRAGDNRGIASALLNEATLFLNNHLPDSAALYFQQAQQQSKKAGAADILLNTYSGMAVSAIQKQKDHNAIQLLDQGFIVLKNNPRVNSYYTLLFLDQAIQVYETFNDHKNLAKALFLKSEIQSVTHNKNNRQYLAILTTGLKNETRILNMEVAKARQEKELAMNRLYLAGLVFLLLAAAFIAYRYYSLQRLKVANLRNKLSQDLHDEIGATLSGIALYSYITRQQNRNEQHEEADSSLEIIEKNATGMVKKLNDIVWTVNPMHDSLYSLLIRLEDFAIETAAPKNITIKAGTEGNIKGAKLSMDERKNIYLICKEAINNAIKYSYCELITIQTKLANTALAITINDNGRGFDATAPNKGNGITNMQSRAAEIGAKLEIISNLGSGTSVVLSFKITQ